MSDADKASLKNSSADVADDEVSVDLHDSQRDTLRKHHVRGADPLAFVLLSCRQFGEVLKVMRMTVVPRLQLRSNAACNRKRERSGS